MLASFLPANILNQEVSERSRVRTQTVGRCVDRDLFEA
jgi:hypothetical protein